MTLATLAPIYWMITISFKREVDQFAVPPRWFWFAPTLEHYLDAFVVRSFGQYLINSLVVAGGSTACALVLGTLAAYSLARFRLPGRLDRKLALWILSTRMFPAIVTAVPLFLIMRDLRLVNQSLADNRLYGFQSSVRSLDDARVLCRSRAILKSTMVMVIRA